MGPCLLSKISACDTILGSDDPSDFTSTGTSGRCDPLPGVDLSTAFAGVTMTVPDASITIIAPESLMRCPQSTI